MLMSAAPVRPPESVKSIVSTIVADDDNPSLLGWLIFAVVQVSLQRERGITLLLDRLD